MKVKNVTPSDIQVMKSEIAEEHGVGGFEEIDRGQLTSRENGDITRTLVALGEQSLEAKRMGEAPGTLEHQNLGYNAKKEGFGPNAKR